MPAPLATDLRIRVVEAYLNGEGTYAQLAERFQVGEASISRWLRRHREQDGSLEPKPTGGQRPRKLTPAARKYLLSLVEDEPTWTAQELADEVLEAYGISVSHDTIGRELRAAGLTHKKGASGRTGRSPQP